MKKRKFVLAFIILITCYSIQAQEGESYINLQAGVTGSIQGADVKTPAFYGSYEYFVGDHLSVGAILGYAPLTLKTYEFVGGGRETEEEVSNIVAGGLVNYYLANGDKFDFYLGGAVGYGSGLTASFLYELHAGGRYALSDNISLNSEVGIGLSLLKVGVSFKL